MSRDESGYQYHFLESSLEGNHNKLLEPKDRIQVSIEVSVANFKRNLAMKRG
jgi:hypothetical protein